MLRRRLAVTCVSTLCLAGVLAPTASAKEEPMDQLARETEWWLSGLGVTDAQKAAHGGEGVKVCLVDDGVDATHEDFKGAHLEGGTDLSGVGVPGGLRPLPGVEKPDHGTAMAAWIVGQGHGPGHSKGILGVAPKATLMSVSTDDNEHHTQLTQLVQGVHYCLDHGAKVISISMGYQPTPEVAADVQKHDAVMVISAGNRKDPDAVNDKCAGMGGLQLGVITVGGVTKEHKISPESCQASDVRNNLMPIGRTTPTSIALGAPSNGGMKANGDAYPLVLAHEVYDPVYAYPYDTLGGGTSTAAALTAGVVALVRAAHPELKAGDVINRLIRTATPVVGASSGPKGPLGFGVVDARAAVSAQVPGTDGANPLGNPATGDGGVWTNAAWKGASSSGASQSGATEASAAKHKGSGAGGSVLVWGVLGVVAVGAIAAVGGIMARRKRGA